MLVARYYAPGDVRMEDMPEPMSDPKEVKLRVRANSICGTDAPDAASCSAEVDPIAEVMRLTEGRGVDVVITAAGSGRAQTDALQMAALRGRISLFGGLPKDKPTLTFDSNVVHHRELTVVGANGSSPAHNRRAPQYIASGDVPVPDLITDRLPLAEFPAGVEAVMGGHAIKVTIEP